MRASRGQSAAFLLLQLGSGCVALGLWAALSHTSLELVDRGSHALALGMIVYLPITLGLPFLLPNFYRSHHTQPNAARFSLMTTVGVAAITSAVGIAISLLGVTVPGLALSFAALIASSALLQQIARIRLSPLSMASGSFYNVILPGGMLLSAYLSLDPQWFTHTALVGATAVVAFLLLQEARRLPRDGGGEQRGAVLRSALPLVPHMLAFAVLAQGVRVPYLIAGDGVVAAHSVMLFVGLALAIITGVHGLLATAVQLAPEEQVRRELRRNLVAYVGLGGLGFLGTIVAYGTDIRTILAGAEPLSAVPLVAMSLTPLFFCLYFYSTSILMRNGSSVRISLVSVPVALAYVTASVVSLRLGTALGGQVTLYSATIAALAAAAFIAGLRSTREVAPFKPAAVDGRE